jgi:2-dehydro-3-deoxyphosphogluconate aldolase / (4S)-4-hydroxy-2-oxoglutarate aldolase
MNSAELRERIGAFPILPVMAVRTVEEGLADIDLLVADGAPVIEILFRTAPAPEVLRRAKSRHPACVFGAGTLLNAGQVKLAVEAGAAFGVSPGLTPALHEAVTAAGLLHMPGVLTASEVMQAREWGYTLLKYYPSEASNGPTVLSDYANIFEDTGFVTTGGIDTGKLATYGAVRNIVAVGGGWMIPSRRAAGEVALREQAAIFKAARAKIQGKAA